MIISETFKPKVVKSNQPTRAPVAMSDYQLIEGTCNNYHPAGDFDWQYWTTDKYISPDVINIAKLASNVRHFKFSGCKIGFSILGILGSNQSSNNGKKAFHGSVGSAVLHGALNYAFNYNTIYSDK